MRLETLDIKNPDTYEIIIGQGNFTVKTIDDFYNVLVSSTPNIDFGVAMNEAKPQITRVEGNNDELKQLASDTAVQIRAGHVFVIYLKNVFPIHCLNAIKNIPTVVNIYAATSNPLQVIITKTDLGNSIVGIVDGKAINRAENRTERQARKDLLQKFGYTTE